MTEPFARLPVAILKNKTLSSWARLLYPLLLSYHTEERGCFPGRERLANDLGVSIPTIDRALNELCEAKLLHKKRQGRGHTNTYSFPDESSPVMSQTPDKSSPATNQTDESSRVMTPESSPVMTPESSPVMTKLDKEELEEVEQESVPPVSPQRKTEPKPKRDPIKEPSGPIQELLAAYCRALNIDRPTNFGKALGQAKQLHQAGLTPEQVKPLIDWLFADPFWAGKGIDLGTCVSQLDKWRSSQRGNGPSLSGPGQPVSGDAEIDQLLARRHWLLTRSGVDSIEYRYDSGRAKARAEAQAIEADLTARGVTSW